VIYTLDKWPSIFVTDKLIFSSERMLHKDYASTGPVATEAASPPPKKILVTNIKGLDAKTN
jgi:hypothetical protein